MAIPSKQIGWSEKANLLWEISRQLDRINSVVCTGPCPTTTTTTTLPPTTTTTTTTPIPFREKIYAAFKNTDACNQQGGTEISAEGDGTTFCNSTILIGSGFASLAPGELFISYGGQVRASNHGAGQNFVTFTSGCSNCP
jgi:hypothetical protein